MHEINDISSKSFATNLKIDPYYEIYQQNGFNDDYNYLNSSYHQEINQTLHSGDVDCSFNMSLTSPYNSYSDEFKDHIILESGPGVHQIKEYNIKPPSIIRINYTPSNSDILIVKLVCDKAMGLKDQEFFLAAVSPKYSADDSDRIYFTNLKISKDMLKGRTKGYTFHLSYCIFSNGEEKYKILSEPFYLWSNVNQNGFPREERDMYANLDAKNIQSKKRKRM